jgi:type IV secretion system protein VirD4
MKNILSLIPVVLLLLIGYPLSAAAVHGLNFSTWPSGIDTPPTWYAEICQTYAGNLAQTYWSMLLGRCPAFVGGGQLQLAGILLPALAAGFLLTSASPLEPRRASMPLYGNARFANASERRRMRVGLELGTDPETGQTIRVALKSNLITLAPPRTGKSSGLLIPNLVAPEREAWFGPCVVIDPKGEAYRAVGERRRALGRKVYCLDPMQVAGGVDTWNPLSNIDPKMNAYLQRTADALLPTAGVGEQKFFREAAIKVIVATFLAAHRKGDATPLRIAELLADQDALAEALVGLREVSAVSTLSMIQKQPKNIGDIFTTAQQAFTWCEDEQLSNLTSLSSFSFDEICRGEADLFITLPTEDMERLSPFLRWLLNDLFAAIRRNKPRERMLIYIDEAKVLGNFKEIVTGYGELPGRNVSFWTFWQNRSQISALYGPDDTKSLISNSEIVTLSDPTPADPDELDLWSRALGDFTIMEENKTVTEATSDKAGSASTSTSLKAVPLMSKEAIASLPASDLLVLVNSQRYPKRPLHIRKTRYDDPRLRQFVKDLGGTADSA